MLMRSYFSVNTAGVRDEALRLRYVSTEVVLEERLRERESDEMVADLKQLLLRSSVSVESIRMRRINGARIQRSERRGAAREFV